MAGLSVSLRRRREFVIRSESWWPSATARCQQGCLRSLGMDQSLPDSFCTSQLPSFSSLLLDPLPIPPFYCTNHPSTYPPACAHSFSLLLRRLLPSLVCAVDPLHFPSSSRTRPRPPHFDPLDTITQSTLYRIISTCIARSFWRHRVAK